MGGVNYIKNLIYCSKLANPETKFIHLGSIDPDLYPHPHPFDEVLHSYLPSSWARRVFQRLARYLGALRLTPAPADIAFAFAYQGVPELAWIADFQHKHYPEFFSSEEVERRDQVFKEKLKDCRRIIVSSENAKEDCLRFFPADPKKIHVYRFSPKINFFPSRDQIAETQKKYQILQNYFFVPNQFWIHKNHRAVFQAVELLKNQGKEVLIVLTGRQHDVRWPHYFDELMTEVKTMGIENQLRFLELIPFEDMLALMVGADAVINPSKFEGWSTTVEEAKALSTPLLLSNIPVHIEQAKDFGGQFFDPNNPTELAQLMAPLVNTRQLTNYQPDVLKEKNIQSCRNAGQRFLQICEGLLEK